MGWGGFAQGVIEPLRSVQIRMLSSRLANRRTIRPAFIGASPERSRICSGDPHQDNVIRALLSRQIAMDAVKAHVWGAWCHMGPKLE